MNDPVKKRLWDEAKKPFDNLPTIENDKLKEAYLYYAKKN